jgi:anti-sigma factor RsiW
MACELMRGKLDAYVDGELSPSEARQFASHIRECPACAADSVERVQMKRAISVAGKAYEPSAEFRRKMISDFTKPPRERRSWGWTLVLVPAALVLIISVSTMLLMNRGHNQHERMFGELADMHVMTLASATPVDVISTDRHTVKPWFEGKIPFSLNLPELQGSDFTLIGGKVAYLGQSPGAQLIYRIRKHQVSVFIFQERGESNAPSSQPLARLSFTFETWSKNGLRYYVVGDIPSSDVETLSNLFRNAS